MTSWPPPSLSLFQKLVKWQLIEIQIRISVLFNVACSTPPGMFWIFVFLTVIFLFLFQLYVLQDAITNMDTATALVNASKYFFSSKNINIIIHPKKQEF